MSDHHQPVRLRGSRGIGDESALHRRLEDANVDYWRQAAGWADDDETMKSYNQGVYNTYYMGDDASGDRGGSSASTDQSTTKALDHLGWILGLASTVIFLMMLVKCCSSAPSQSDSKGRTSSVKSRDSSRSMRDKHGERRSQSRSHAGGRARSKSRPRSKSRGRKASGDADYKLMDDDDDNRSRRSTKSSSSKRSTRSRSRSKSKGARSRSRSKARSKSKSRGDRGDEKSTKEEKRTMMLV